MTEVTPAWLLAAGAVTVLLAFLGTRAALALARRRRLLDHPNERSSHTEPTPRGGGLGMVAAVTVGLGVHALVLSWQQALALLPVLPAVLGAALVGWRDDLAGLPPLRKMVWLAAASAFALWHGPLEAVTVPWVGEVELAWLAVPLSVFWLAGFANAFNFMDGVDGIAAATAAVSGAAFAVAGVRGGVTEVAVLGSLTSAAALGFLPWNFPRARIFMGDVGSLPLGLLLAATALSAARHGAMAFPASVLLLGPFVFDTAFTLARRAARGARIGEAHREHLYQRLSRLCGSHPPVTLTYALFSVVTGSLAVLYGNLGELGQGLSLVLPLGAMLGFAGAVLWAERRMGAEPRG